MMRSSSVEDTALTKLIDVLVRTHGRTKSFTLHSVFQTKTISMRFIRQPLGFVVIGARLRWYFYWVCLCQFRSEDYT